MTLTRTSLKLGSLWAAVLVAAVGCDEKNPALVETPPPVVQVARPVERTVTDFQIFTARTQASQSVDVKARVTGYLTEIHFIDGGLVKKDQVLFRIDNRPYKAALDKAKADLEDAKGKLEIAEGNYGVAVDVYKRDSTAISKQQLLERKGQVDVANGAVDVGAATVENAQLNYDWCTVTSPISGRANRHFIDIGNLVSQDTSVLTNIVNLTPMWAYFDVDENTALQVQKLVREGKMQSVRPMSDPRQGASLMGLLAAPAGAGPLVAAAALGPVPVEVQMSLSNEYNWFPHNGSVDFISNQLDPNTGSIQVRATFPNKDELLQAGLFGRVRVPVSAPHAALLVRDEAVGTNQGERYVLVVNDKDEVEYRPVDVGQMQDDLREVKRFRTIIKSDEQGRQTSREVEVLKATDRILINGLQRVRPGAKVKPELIDMVTQLPVK